MNKITTYFEEAYDELMHKVTWPTWGELQDSAVVVLITAVIISVAVLFVDVTFREASKALYKILLG